MRNSFFENSLDETYVRQRLRDLKQATVGFYSIGLYPASLVYNVVMQSRDTSPRIMIAPRPGRELLGAFTQDAIQGMDREYVVKMHRLAHHDVDKQAVPNTLEDLIKHCDLVLLSANSNYIEGDLEAACQLREKLDRHNVVLACLAGSFSHDPTTGDAYVLCEKQPNLAFFTGFHRHGALRDPLDSFTANFCHPNALTALLGAYILDQLSLNIQVSPGVHNVEAQYIKAAKNMASIFAGFGYTFHQDNPGILPTLLTLLLNQCIDQAATVSMSRRDHNALYNNQPIALTELGYGVPRIEATLNIGGDMEKVRDHTFSQLTAMVADVRGSMMRPVTGQPTRNFQAGRVLARLMQSLQRCPLDIEEFENWCRDAGLKGGLEGVRALRYWPLISAKYEILVNDSSMVNLLYTALFGTEEEKQLAYQVMTSSRELSSYCQESVRPTHSRKYALALSQMDQDNEASEAMDLLANAVIADNAQQAIQDVNPLDASGSNQSDDPAYMQVMSHIENNW